MESARAFRWLLAGIVLLAFLHALASARLRPMYQVSDEINYIFRVQHAALPSAGGAAQECIAPPHGDLLPLWFTPGKSGFAAVTSAQLSWLCTAGGAFPLFELRALQALAFPVIALAAAYLGWLVSADRATALLAALLSGMHPVGVVHAGAVTPDAWANGWSALALVAGARLLLQHGRWWDVPVLVVTTLAAVLWKDTTTFLLLHAALVVGVLVARWTGQHVRGTPRRAGLALGIVALCVLGASQPLSHLLPGVFISPYFNLYNLTAAGIDPFTISRPVLEDAALHAPAFLESSFTAIGNFGASTLALPTGVEVLTWATLLLLAIGLSGRLVLSPPNRTLTLYVAWALSAAACLLQPSVRQVLVGTGDIHQGRWLLPLLAPACAVAGYGLTAALRSAGGVAVFVCAWCAATLVTLLMVGQHLYARFPATLDVNALFLRATGGTLVDDGLVLTTIQMAHQSQSTVVTWSILGLLVAVAAGVCVGFLRLPGRNAHV